MNRTKRLELMFESLCYEMGSMQEVVRNLGIESFTAHGGAIRVAKVFKKMCIALRILNYCRKRELKEALEKL